MIEHIGLPLLPVPTSDRFGRSISYLENRQRELEADTIDQAVNRFREKITKNIHKGDETRNPAVRELLEWSVTRMVDAVNAFLAAEEAKTRGSHHTMEQFLRWIGPERAAAYTADAIFRTISGKVEASKLERTIAERILNQLKYDELKAQAPGLYRRRLASFNGAGIKHKKRSLDAAVYSADIDISELILGAREKQFLGTKCLDLFIQATTLPDGEAVLEIDRRSTRDHQFTSIVATQRTLTYILERHKTIEANDPYYLPMVVAPKPWTGIDKGGRGGYPAETRLRRKQKLVRRKRSLEYLKDADLSVVFHALNTLQGTAWLINKDVFDELEYHLFTDRAGDEQLPGYAEKRLPHKPPELSIPVELRTDEQAAIAKKYRDEAAKIKNENHILRGKAFALGRTIVTARTLLDLVDDENKPLPFYFPYNLDFRGRAYPIPLFLNPQGNDVQKGLLMFAEGKPLGSEAAVKRLALHGASCLGTTSHGIKLSQKSLDWRTRWVEQNSDRICEIAEDPRSNKEWRKADEPYQYLAFCFEWAGYKREGLSFISHLPVGMDCSCNGLQLYSALLRNQAIASKVNLTISDSSRSPGDIYEVVREQVEPRLRTDANGAGPRMYTTVKERRVILNGKPVLISKYRTKSGKLRAKYQTEQVETVRLTNKGYAQDWLNWNGNRDQITRKMVKPIVMTLPYSATTYRAAQQLQAAMLKLGSRRPDFIHEDEEADANGHLMYLARLIREDILSEICKPANECMNWFKWLASLVVNSNAVEGLKKSIIWSVPETGFVVEQDYRESQMQRIDTTLFGVRHEPSFWVDTDELDMEKHITAVAPNIIHSLDAAIMMTTVSRAKQAGIDFIAAVHDCYSTHAADAEELNAQLRLAFMYLFDRQDMLDHLEQDLLANVPSTELRAFAMNYRSGDALTDTQRAMLLKINVDPDKTPPVAKPMAGNFEIAEILMSNVAM